MAYVITSGTMEEADNRDYRTYWTMPMALSVSELENGSKFDEDQHWVISRLEEGSPSCSCGVSHHDTLELETAQKVVGGYVERVPIPNISQKRIQFSNAVNAGLITVNKQIIESAMISAGVNGFLGGVDNEKKVAPYLHYVPPVTFTDMEAYLLVDEEARLKKKGVGLKQRVNLMASMLAEQEILGPAIIYAKGEFE
jgi:hypothetical protein